MTAMTSDLVLLFAELLRRADLLRPGYVASLGKPQPETLRAITRRIGSLPELATTIYGAVAGTVRETERQEFFDFVPGLRLIHIQDLLERTAAVSRILGKSGAASRRTSAAYLPFLEDYSEHFVCRRLGATPPSIVALGPEEEPEIICKDEQTYLRMLNAFYAERVYFVDADRYLDYDFEKEGLIGQQFNPDLIYWRAEQH